MNTARESYLGWDLLRHFEGCKRPEWIPEVKVEDNAYRPRRNGAEHACPNDECLHRDRYSRTTVRIVCFSCTRAHTLGSEESLRAGSANTVTDGYGQPPRRLSGLLLWPGALFESYGLSADDQPWDFLVTRPGVRRVTQDSVVAVISQCRGKRDAVRWSAAAVRDDAGEFGYEPLRFAASVDAAAGLRTPAAAAKWVAARLAETPAGGAS